MFMHTVTRKGEGSVGGVSCDHMRMFEKGKVVGSVAESLACSHRSRLHAQFFKSELVHAERQLWTTHETMCCTGALHASRPEISTHQSKNDPALTSEEIFEKEKAAFYRLKVKLLQDEKYVGKYVAIVNEEIVDIGDDRLQLIRKVYDKKGYIPMYVGKIALEETIHEDPSAESI